jgi:hypothetical protein
LFFPYKIKILSNDLKYLNLIINYKIKNMKGSVTWVLPRKRDDFIETVPKTRDMNFQGGSQWRVHVRGK